jgi:malonyl CoA-acyl carrier protein transacylase
VSAASSERSYGPLMREALRELQRLRTRLDEVTREQTEPIAIIGMSCRLPGGVDGPEAYWRLLRSGVDAIREVPRDRWDPAAYYHPDPEAPGKMATAFGGFLEQVDAFDPAFFGISPREARTLDPQQRLLLEVSWEALELSGESPARLYGSATGVFIGMSTFDYALHQVGGDVDDHDLQRIDGYVATGTTMSPAAGRLSYVLGLNGPSMVVDTACSSSLVATHLAVASLRSRECDLALVGGVNLMLRPEWYVNFTKAHMLAPDGRCKTFDAAANGYSRGEGCGVVVLQRLSEAVTARRRILAVIRGSAVNQDGASGGLTVPSGPSQEHVIRRALDRAGVRPEEVSYVEAHGTGTSLGDPIEVAAIGAVFGAARSRERPLQIGSVKTNIGHLEAAAGIAGLMKVALSLRNEEIPPHLHFTHGNPMIDWEGLAVAVPVERTPWPSGSTPRRAGISSFGFTGTNAHLVLEEAPAAVPRPEQETERPRHLLTLSARTPGALAQLTHRYARHLADRPELSLRDVAFTANTGRAHFRHRLAVVAGSRDEARTRLEACAGGHTPAGVSTGQAAEPPRIAFLFTGQGSQYVGMGRQLYDAEPVFRDALDQCDRILRVHLNRPLLEVIHHPSGDASSLDDTAYTQPALFALEYALAALWKSWGIEPGVVMGHSIGEYVAACVAGVFSLEDGLALVSARGRLMQALSHAGRMVAVQAGEDRAAAALLPHASEVSLAAINGPGSVVISGTAAAVSEVVASLEAAGVHTQSLRVSHAFHSPLMEPMMADFEQVARRVAFSPPRTPIVSNVTGRLARAELASPEYWVGHVRKPVRFADGMETLREHGCRIFVELGPGSTLLALGRQCLPDPESAWLPSLGAGSESERMLHTLGELYTRGAEVDWAGVEGARSREPVELPTYPFQRQRYWVDITRRAREEPTQEGTRHSGAAPEAETIRSAEHLYGISWHERPPASGEASPPPDGRWIVVRDKGSLGLLLADHLRERGVRCTLVSAEGGLARLGPDEITVPSTQPADLSAVWASLPAGESIRGVVHLSSLDAPRMEDLDREGCQPGAVLEGALRVIQSVAEACARPVAVWCVTRGAVSVNAADGARAMSLMQSPLWGLGRVAALEHPDISGGLLDLGLEEDLPSDVRTLARELLAPDGEDQIALRGGTRYVPRLVRRDRPVGPSAALDSAGTYIVMGGLGALGLHAARWLASKGARTVVLASRRGAATPGTDEVLRELRTLGARTVTAVRADVSSAADVDALLAQVAASGMPLRGVVHAAGTDAPVPLAEMTGEDVRRMLASKVRGAWLLHEKTRHLDLDLFVCFSSVSAVWGAPGRGHYAAANAFLDALAHERRRLGLPALSVNWGPWLGGGLAGTNELRRLEHSGLRGLEPSAALHALETLVAGGDVQAVVADVEWPRFRAGFEARRRRPLFDGIEEDGRGVPGLVTEREGADWRVQLSTLPAAERHGVLAELLRAEVAVTLGFQEPRDVPVDQSVFELGMDSLRAVELALRLQRHLGLERPIPLFACPQVDVLAGRLLADVGLPEAGAPAARHARDAAPPVPSPSGTASPRGAHAGSAPEAQGVIGYAPSHEAELLEFARVAWPERPAHLVVPRWVSHRRSGCTARAAGSSRIMARCRSASKPAPTRSRAPGLPTRWCSNPIAVRRPAHSSSWSRTTSSPWPCPWGRARRCARSRCALAGCRSRRCRPCCCCCARATCSAASSTPSWPGSPAPA